MKQRVKKLETRFHLCFSLATSVSSYLLTVMHSISVHYFLSTVVCSTLQKESGHYKPKCRLLLPSILVSSCIIFVDFSIELTSIESYNSNDIEKTSEDSVQEDGESFLPLF